MIKRPEVKVRFDTKAQKDRIVRAAKVRKWSFNQFVIEAADQEAARLLTAQDDGPLTDLASLAKNASS